MLHVLRQRPREAPGQRSREALRQFWVYGWPMAIWLTTSALLLYVDRLIIGALLGSAEAGAYAAVSDVIVRGFSMVAFPLTMASHPEIMRQWNAGSRAKAFYLIRVYRNYLLGLCAIVALASVLFGTELLELVLGIEIENPALVPALVLGAALWQVGLMTHKPLEMANQTRLMVVIIVGITVATSSANFFLIPVLGVGAAAYAFCLGALAYVVISSTFAQKIQKSMLPVEYEMHL